MEAVSALRQSVYAVKFDPRQALEAVEIVISLGIEIVLLSSEKLQSVLRWAKRLGQIIAYAAQYVVLAEQLKADLWSAD